MTPALEAIVRDLEATPEHTAASLATALRRPLTIDDVAAYIRFASDNYVRSLVTRTERWELRLLCWRPGQSSSLHAHGPAACAFRVLRGSATEAILGQRDRTWAPGDVIEEGGPHLVHQVSNAGTDALLSLHAYSPRLPVDAPSSRHGRDIAIIGGGLSGVAVAVHLLKRGGPDLRISLIERGPWLGRGVAYGVDSEVFRLNVPAAKMSLDPAEPGDFVRWAGDGTDPHAFLPRTRYAAYVVQRFADALRASSGKLRVIRGEAASLDGTGVTLIDGRRISAESIVLATGLAPRIAPSVLPSDPRIIDAWDECALAALPRDGHLLVLGAGLSALDVIAFLAAHRYAGRVSIVSRRGLLPRPHLAHHTAGAPLSKEAIAQAPRELRQLLRWGRALVAQTKERGAPWQHAIDSLRPHVATLWRNLPPADRARFVRSVRPYWDVLRHRAPHDAHELLEAWRSAGRLEVRAGAVVACAPSAAGLDIDLRAPGGSIQRTRFDAVVRCIGPALERAETDAPLVHALLSAGRAHPDPAGLGIETDEHGRVVGSENVFALGALRRASSWETTAVPDISVHAAAIAQQILAPR